MNRVFISIFTIAFLLGCSNGNNSSTQEKEITSNNSKKDTIEKGSNSSQKVQNIEQDKANKIYDSLRFYFKTFRYGNNAAYAYDLSEYLLEDGIKMLPWTHTDENHFFKFEDMEMIWITSNNLHNNYSLIIQDKSGHKNIFPDSRIDCNNLLNIYYCLNTFLNTKIPNCKTLFEIEKSYERELASNNEFITKNKQRKESAKTHNETHIPQNFFESNCEFCKRDKLTCYTSPSTFTTLERYFKNWIVIQNKNYSIVDKSKELIETKVFGVPWNSISRVSIRIDGNPGNFKDTKSSTFKTIQKYILTIQNAQGLTQDFPIFLPSNDNTSLFVNSFRENLKKYQKRIPVNID